MTEGEMFGVVLWSDQPRNRALIWCEDHGDLAFFDGEDAGHSLKLVLVAGDLVRFDLQDHRHVRVARNPRLVRADEYPTLTDDLQNAGIPPKDAPDGSAKVVVLRPMQELANASEAAERQVI